MHRGWRLNPRAALLDGLPHELITVNQEVPAQLFHVPATRICHVPLKHSVDGWLIDSDCGGQLRYVDPTVRPKKFFP